MRRRPWLLVGLAWGAFGGGTESSALAQEPLSWGQMQGALEERGLPASTRIAYGPGANRFGELALPPGPGPHPVAVVIHGGCWLSLADLSYVRPLARELNAAGWATWVLEFNRIDEEEGAWPGILEDVARGVDHLRELGRTYPLDLARVAAFGHSSGGHLALWAAARPRLPGPIGGPGAPKTPEPLSVQGVIGLAPVASLEDFQRRSDRCGSTIVPDLLGLRTSSVEEEGGPLPRVWEDRLGLTDPERLLPLGVPQLLVFGADDRIVPPAHGTAWREVAESRGDEVHLHVVSGAGHFELVAPWTEPWGRVAEKLAGFLGTLKSGA